MEQQEILLDIPQEKEKTGDALLSFSDFLKQQEIQKDPEEKIRGCILFMQSCLSREGPPSFKDFWEVRKLCLLLFKETLSPKVRSELWESYIGLTTEAYHLKEMMDSESSFAREQIESAIHDLQQNLENFSTLLSQVPHIELPEECSQFAPQSGSYDGWNQQLHLLHSFAERIHALRKEILKTQMRFRFKNKLLDKLMKLGDQIFPRRKDLTQQLSHAFLNDVESYINGPFSKELEHSSIFALKDTVKAFQFVARQLYLSSEVVTKAKDLLSQCWEKIQVKEKEKKGELAQKKEVYRANYDELFKKLQDLECRFTEGKIEGHELEAAADQLQQEMAALELGRDEVRSLKQQFQQLRKKLVEKQNKATQEKKKLLEELENQRQDSFQSLKSEIQSALEGALDLELMLKKQSLFEEEKKRLILHESEMRVIESLLRELKMALFDKRQEILFTQSESQSDFSEKLQELLDERKKMRQEIKKELESVRKLSGGSGLDFEKAMFYRELMDSHKELLDRMESSVIEIEEKLFDL